MDKTRWDKHKMNEFSPLSPHLMLTWGSAWSWGGEGGYCQCMIFHGQSYNSIKTFLNSFDHDCIRALYLLLCILCTLLKPNYFRIANPIFSHECSINPPVQNIKFILLRYLSKVSHDHTDGWQDNATFSSQGSERIFKHKLKTMFCPVVLCAKMLHVVNYVLSKYISPNTVIFIIINLSVLA